MKALLLVLLLLAGFKANAQTPPPPLVACVTNIILYTSGNAYFTVGDGTNHFIQWSDNGLNILNTALHLYLDHCPTNSGTLVATVAWQCNVNTTCPGGPHGESTYCGGGGSFDITAGLNEDEIHGYIEGCGDGCCCLRFVKTAPIVFCIPPAPHNEP
jgi:hypothetical protein